MPAIVPHMLLDVNDTRLYVDERGSGPALLILHGGPGLDHTMFGSWLDPLADTYRLLLVDGREQGRSDRGTDPSTWVLEQHASDVAALASALQLERYAVLGHSYGAFVALQHAVDFPGAAVATVASSGIASMSYVAGVPDALAAFEPLDLREQVASSWEREATVQTEEEFRQLMNDQWPWHFKDPRDPRIAGLDDPRAVFSPAVLRATSLEGGGLAIEVEDRLGEVPQPVLAITGRYDRTCPVAASESIAARAPRGELVVLEGSGHMTFLEQPTEYVAAVRDFLSRAF